MEFLGCESELQRSLFFAIFLDIVTHNRPSTPKLHFESTVCDNVHAQPHAKAFAPEEHAHFFSSAHETMSGFSAAMTSSSSAFTGAKMTASSSSSKVRSMKKQSTTRCAADRPETTRVPPINPEGMPVVPPQDLASRG